MSSCESIGNLINQSHQVVVKTYGHSFGLDFAISRNSYRYYMRFRVAGQRGNRPSGMRDLRLLSTLYRKQAQIYKRSQAALERRIADEMRLPNWKMPASVLDEMQAIDAFLRAATNGMLATQQAIASANEAAEVDVLAAQLKVEFFRSMTTWSVEDWQIVERFQRERVMAQAITAPAIAARKREVPS